MSPTALPRTNLRFDHISHESRVKAECEACHMAQGAPQMAVRLAVVENCLPCHGVTTDHLAAPDAACATCHVPLAKAVRLTAQDVAEFPKPPSHDEVGFAEQGGHGVLASAATGVAASCATCHARDFCTQCHLGDAEQPIVQALEPDARSLALDATPRSHAGDWVGRHAGQAAASPETCASCHVRADCLDCHRPGAASGGPGYHPADFLARHPSAAYSRETSCSDCHNNRAFCTDCHQSAGLVTRGELRSGYHDAKQFFLLGHGQAARQSLESCVACHAEADCLSCHSAQGPYRLNPHGPDFDARRLKDKNVVQCSVCHGANIPER
jgi:hypothetical protein